MRIKTFGLFIASLLVSTQTVLISPARTASEPQRNFYDVLEDVLGDFEFDLKNGNVSGLKNISIRNIALSENVPHSFKNHLELLITERILKSGNTHVLQCLPCRAKKTSLNRDQVVVSSPENNPVEQARIAKMTGIDHFMDIAFSYEPSGMILSLFVTDPENEAVIWSRTYNSETTRAAAYRRGVDFSQVDEARSRSEYTPVTQHRLILSYLFEPSLPTSAGCLSLGYRMMERYDNRKKEVGFELNYLADSASLINPAGTSSSNVYKSFGFNLTVLFVHAWNLIGDEENFNRARGSIVTAIGGTYAGGYLSGLIRAGYEFRLAKHFALSPQIGYRPPSAAFIGSQSTGTIQGLEYGLGVNFIF